jgi:hypothetical protein
MEQLTATTPHPLPHQITPLHMAIGKGFTVIPRYTSNRFTSFHLYDKLIPVFQFMSQFSHIQAPSSRKPVVIPFGRKLILVLRVFALQAILEE